MSARGCLCKEQNFAGATRGSPSDVPLADIFFAMSQTPILLCIETCLLERDALFPVRIPTSPVLFAPGDCVPTRLCDSTLVDGVVLLTVILDICLCYGFPIIYVIDFPIMLLCII